MACVRQLEKRLATPTHASSYLIPQVIIRLRLCAPRSLANYCRIGGVEQKKTPSDFALGE
jgi:hypothetical protein